MKEKEKVKQTRPYKIGVGLLIFILFCIWIYHSSVVDDYQSCAESCASDNEFCMSDYSLTIQDYYDCVSEYNSCLRTWAGASGISKYCLDSFNPCVEDYLDALDSEATACSDDLSYCIDDCNLN